jgi:ATP-dependent Clp protease protease subunit
MSIPYVIENTRKGEVSYDLYSRLLKDRIIFVTGQFQEQMANSIVAQLLFLEANEKDKDIYMYINSSGGDITAMYAIYDTMTCIKPDIVTIGFGTVMSAGSFILAAGTKGKRFALPNTSILIHELSGGAGGKFNDISIRYKSLERLYNKMAEQYSDMTGQKVSKIKKDMERDYYMTADEAKAYGLIDDIQSTMG